MTGTRTSDTRRAKEAAIRGLDIVVYMFAIGSGIFALAVPPEGVQRWLAGWEWLQLAWGILLIVSGTFGLVGRVTRVWMIEIPGPAGAFFGELMYLVVLVCSAWDRPGAWVAAFMIGGAAIALLRRWIELQIFTTDPEVKTFTDRLVAALRRRTSNVAGQHR